MPLPDHIREEKDLEPYERLFANTAYWKRIGEEYQNPLIVTGTVLFAPHSRAGFVSRDVEQYDSFGRRRVVPVRTYLERKGFILRPKFVFIDGRTGATMHSESYREEVLYNSQQNTPALSSYFELMDRLVPEFPDRAQQPEDQRHPRAAALDRFTSSVHDDPGAVAPGQVEDRATGIACRHRPGLDADRRRDQRARHGGGIARHRHLLIAHLHLLRARAR